MSDASWWLQLLERKGDIIWLAFPRYCNPIIIIIIIINFHSPESSDRLCSNSFLLPLLLPLSWVLDCLREWLDGSLVRLLFASSFIQRDLWFAFLEIIPPLLLVSVVVADSVVVMGCFRSLSSSSPSSIAGMATGPSSSAFSSSEFPAFLWCFAAESDEKKSSGSFSWGRTEVESSSAAACCWLLAVVVVVVGALGALVDPLNAPTCSRFCSQVVEGFIFYFVWE